MDWKTDSNINESDSEHYSSFQSNKTGKLFDRMELPIILIGAGLLALVILFVLFIPKKNEITIDDYKHLVSRMDQLEQKIKDLGGTDLDIREFDPSKNPVQYQQMINWIKSNAEVISETIKKVDELENEFKSVQKSKVSVDVTPPSEKPVQQKLKAAATVKSTEQLKPVEEKRSQDKSKLVPVKPQDSAKPIVTPKPEIKAVPVTEPESAVEPTRPEIETKPVPAKPETVKMIFHRVEKGETLYRISRKYGISVQKLQELNGMKKDDLIINVGQELIVSKEKQ